MEYVYYIYTQGCVHIYYLLRTILFSYIFWNYDPVDGFFYQVSFNC